ncbi:MAG: single-stranded-DNA-specific exonuclease RecJ [Deltaproteobacteria bacterium]|jgi:single-stranded-DNA-specific exonuclease|nr:single-stranded-DNA-specific exonuclease RecJ [Deltaproteobacteria bacterium]
MIWNYCKESDKAAALEIAASIGKPLHYAQFLMGRGYRTRAEIKAFVAPELASLPLPESMPNMAKAVGAFMRARERNDTVAIAGDFDADGLTATAVLSRILRSLGYKVITSIPNRFSDGYGLSVKTVEGLKRMGAGLLVTVDCGVSDAEAVDAANALGLPVVVTDHHHIPPVLPSAEAVVNPHLGGGWERSPMAGVGVAFMLAWAVQRALKFKGICPATSKTLLVEHLALVAIGTIADLVPLTGVNRTLVRHGLRCLSKTSWPSLAALVSSSRLDDPNAVTVRDVGFSLAPKLNAAGRLGSADPALELLVTEDPLRAKILAESLDSINRYRYEGQKKLQATVMAKLEAEGGACGRTVVMAGEGWPRGLLGLAASRVAEEVRKPTVLLSLEGDLAMGSGRSAPGFNLFSALSRARELCLSMGGHSEAAGLKLKREKLQAFKEAFEEAAALQPEPPGEDELKIDLECALDDLQPLRKLVRELEPFGQGHPAPVAVVRNVSVTDAGPARSNGDKHLAFRVTDGLQSYSVMGFNMAPRLSEVAPAMDLALVYTGTNWGHRDPGWTLLDLKRPGESPCPWGDSWRAGENLRPAALELRDGAFAPVTPEGAAAVRERAGVAEGFDGAGAAADAADGSRPGAVGGGGR